MGLHSMQTYRTYKLATVVSMAALAVGVVACNNDKLTSINTNPNSPTDAPAGAIFTNAVQTSMGRWFGFGDLRTTEFVVQQQTEDQYSDEDRYVRIDPAST